MSVLATRAVPLAKVDYGKGVSDAWANVVAFVPKFVAFLIIVVIGYFIAKALEKVLAKVLQRVGFDRLVERGGVKKALSNSKYDAAGILGRLVFFAVMLFALSTAFGVFGPNPISTYLRSIIGYLPKVFAALVIVVVAAAISAAVKALIQNSLGGLSYGRLLGNLAAAFVISLGVIAALDQLNIARNVVNAVLIASLATIAGIAIVAVGGGGIEPMRQRWQTALTRYDMEKPRMQEAIRTAPSVKQQAEQAAAQARPPQDYDLRDPNSDQGSHRI
ncbi:MAG: hypothetical protein ABJA34_03305 [Pseudonocardiales bacterium]